MSDSVATQLKTTAFLMLGFAAVIGVYEYGLSVEKTFPTRTFSVEGTAKIETPQELALFTASVISEGGADTAALQTENSNKMNALIERMKALGVEERDLKTLQYNVSPRYETSACQPGQPCPPAGIAGYTVSQSLEVRVRNVDQAGELLQAAVSEGANSVSDIRFVPDEAADVKSGAREEAMRDARKKAEELAAAGGFKVGRIVALYETSGGMPQPYALGGAEMDARSAAAPAIQPGVNEGEVRMTVTYEIR